MPRRAGLQIALAVVQEHFSAAAMAGARNRRPSAIRQESTPDGELQDHLQGRRHGLVGHHWCLLVITGSALRLQDHRGPVSCQRARPVLVTIHSCKR